MDTSIYRWVNRLANHTHWAHGVARAYANYGVVLFAALLLVTYLVGRSTTDFRQQAAAVLTGGATLLAVGIGQVIGHAVERARPYAAMADVHVLVNRSTDFSFPSDHATMAGAVAVGLFLASRRWGVPALVLGLLMAATRVYVGAHYPGDVLAGFALGGAVAAALVLVGSKHLGKLLARLAQTPLRLLVTPR